MIEVYDNILPVEYIKHVKTTLMDASFPWYYWPKAIPLSMKATHVVRDDTKYTNPSQLKHVLLFNNNKSYFYNIIQPILDSFSKHSSYNIIKVHTSACIMQHPVGTIKTIQPHIDFSKKEDINNELKTIIFYVNGSDGNTTLYKEFCTGEVYKELTVEDVLEPIEGRIAIINADQFHSGSEPSKDIRVLLNIIVEVNKKLL